MLKFIKNIHSGLLCACVDAGDAAARWLGTIGISGESGDGGADGDIEANGMGPARYALELEAARGEWARAADIARRAAPALAPSLTLNHAMHLELT